LGAGLFPKPLAGFEKRSGWFCSSLDCQPDALPCGGISGEPTQISTSYVERQNLTIRMGSKRFARLSNGFSKRLECHLAAVALQVAYYNFCRVHESLRSTPAVALGIVDHVWTIAEIIEAALGAVPPLPSPTAPERRRRFRVIEAGKT
jgi:hypothetical protein